MFDLSNNMRLNLFRSFVKNIGHNMTNSIIFTVMIDFSQDDDIDFLNEISSIFLNEEEDVYFIELVTTLEERLKRNTHPLRLKAKPSKRDIDSSTNEIKHAAKNYRLETTENELEKFFPKVNSLKIDKTALNPDEVCQLILSEYPNL